MLSNFVVAATFTLFFLILGWRWGARTGVAFSFMKKRLLLYGIAFVLGEVYLIYWFADLRWPRLPLFAAIVSWGALLGSGVWYRARRGTGQVDP